ncbi:MAG TPA: hypothetical protein VEA44_11000 [Caulobacter sp.]|nr:hypothetical protein [Caulobacter sp.]
MATRPLSLALAAAAFSLFAGAACANELILLRGPEGQPYRITFSGGGWGDRTYALQDESMIGTWSGSYTLTVEFPNAGIKFSQPMTLMRGNGVRNRGGDTTYWCLFVGADQVIMDSGSLCRDLVDLKEGYPLE